MAFAILTVMCLCYYNIPLHAACQDGSTDHKHEPNFFWLRGEEGFAWGKINNDGYLNLFDYEKDLPISVLIMGSSHMAAYQVMMPESTASRLNRSWGGNVYSIGIAGHSFLNCANNIQAAVKKYRPLQYIVVETGHLNLQDQSIEDVLNGKFKKRPLKAQGILGALHHNPFLRLLYRTCFNQRWEAPESSAPEQAEENNPELLAALLRKMRDAARTSGAKLIIAYHPGVALNEDGSLRLESDGKVTAQFAGICQETGVYFLDMGRRFLEEYARDHILPYGFRNTSVGKGHLNREGHRMMADELFKLMKNIEGGIEG